MPLARTPRYLTGLTLVLAISLNFPVTPRRSQAHAAPPAQAVAEASLAATDQPTEAQASKAHANLPMIFEANHGQVDPEVRFISRGQGYTLFLTDKEAVFVLSSPRRIASSVPVDLEQHGAQSSLRGRLLKEELRRQDAVAAKDARVVRMKLAGANAHPLVAGYERLPGKDNYFIGSDSRKWRANIPTFAGVRYEAVYPGIDMVYYGNQRQLEYDFVVAPFADPRAIALDFKGADKLDVDASGDLVLHAGGKQVRQHRPVVYQEVNGVRQEIPGSYLLKNSGGQVGFQLGSYDASRPLVIDPVVYSTFLGGDDYDVGQGIAVDRFRNAYVTGYTYSLDFPSSKHFNPGQYQYRLDAFITKLNANGNAFVYSTYVGGQGGDFGQSIAVDANRNAYITGGTYSTNLPTPNGFQNGYGGGYYDGFVAKLNVSGSKLLYASYLGGNDFENYRSGRIAVDQAENAYLTGFTMSFNFPVTPGALKTTFSGGHYQDNPDADPPPDAFVTKVNTRATGPASLVYSTYLGGAGTNAFDWGTSIDVDSSGNAYATGDASSRFPTTANAYRRRTGSSYVAKLNPAGTALLYSTYFDGRISDIAVRDNGQVYLTGTAYYDFQTTPDAYQTMLSEIHYLDTFVAKLDTNASGRNALVYATFFGGSADEYGRSIAIDATGDNVYITGETQSSDLPTTPDAYQSSYGGVGDFDTAGFIVKGDAFVAKFNIATPGTAGLVYSTYLGGNRGDDGNAIAVDSVGSVYVTGGTYSPNFPVTPGAFQTVRALTDAFVVKIRFR